ncbi:unnamed protein product, partial [Adineta steineri]
MQEALDHSNKETNKRSRNKIYILDYLAYTTSQQGNIENTLSLTEMLTIGNRITTWLAYLSDVEQGSAAIFPPVDNYLKLKKKVLHF